MKLYRGDRIKILKHEHGAPTGFKTVVMSIDYTGASKNIVLGLYDDHGELTNVLSLTDVQLKKLTDKVQGEWVRLDDGHLAYRCNEKKDFHFGLIRPGSHFVIV